MLNNKQISDLILGGKIVKASGNYITVVKAGISYEVTLNSNGHSIKYRKGEIIVKVSDYIYSNVRGLSNSKDNYLGYVLNITELRTIPNNLNNPPNFGI